MPSWTQFKHIYCKDIILGNASFAYLLEPLGKKESGRPLVEVRLPVVCNGECKSDTNQLR